jgi:adenylate cyclase
MMGKQQAAGVSGMDWPTAILVYAVAVPAGLDAASGITHDSRDSGIVTDRATISRVLRRPAVSGVLQGLVLFICLVAVRETGVLQPLELEAYDLFMRLSGDDVAADSRVALINITEADIQQLGQWPLSDESLSSLITSLQAHNPEVIGVDIYRDLPVPPGSAQLDAVLSQNSNVIVVEKIGAGENAGVLAPGILEGTGQVGFSDLLVDPDGVVRRGLLFLDNGADVFYSLSLRLALHYLQSRDIYPQPGEPDPSHLRLGEVTLQPFEANDGGYVDADAGGYQFMMDYREGSQPFVTYSLGNLLAGEIPPGALTGRVVIVGVAAESVKDDFLIPFRHAGHDAPGVPGSSIHAHATSQLLRAALDSDRPIGVPTDVQEYAWILFWTAAGVALVLLFRTAGILVPVALVGVALLLVLSYLAYAFGLWLPLVPAGIGGVASAALMTAYLTSYENAQRRQVMDLFSRQVSEDVAREIWKQRDHFMEGGRVAPREVVCTVLAADLENFTPVSEQLGPARLMDWLNRYMDTMASLVLEHGGIVDDYYGDAIMADFGVPLERMTEVEYDQDARNAVDCALAMREAIAQLNDRNAGQNLPPVRMRIGIATGEMVVGFLGTSQRMKYTTIGDTVNTAARLESYGKELPPMDVSEGGCRILVAESTARRLGDACRVESVGALELKGKREVVNVYKVLSREA